MARHAKQNVPRWVVVNGAVHNVSDFAGIRPSERPEAQCPVCEDLVTLKLGGERVHHYAHQPESQCPATQPETALHLNTKFYLAAQIRQAERLTVELACQGRCGAVDRRVWAEGWDAVEVEYRVDTLRPDIALLHSGKAIAAIEVLATHAVDLIKERRLAEARVPWVEVIADPTLFDEETAWTAQEPIPSYRASADLAPWICPGCLARREAAQRYAEGLHAQRAAAAASASTLQPGQNEQEQGRSEHVHAAKMVDLYFRSGKKYREVYFVVQRTSWGRQETIVRTERGEMVGRVPGEMTRESLDVLNNAVKTHLGGFVERGAMVDERIPWRRWVKGQRFIARDIDRFPFRYVWDRNQGAWREEGR